MVKLKVGSPNRGATVDTSSISPDLSHYLRDDEAIDTGVANGTNTITGLATVFDAGTTKAINIAPGTDNRAGIFEIRDDQNNYVTESAGVYQNRVASPYSTASSKLDYSGLASNNTLTLSATGTESEYDTAEVVLIANRGSNTRARIEETISAAITGVVNRMRITTTTTETTIYSKLGAVVDAPTLTVPAITSSSADTCAATKKYVDSVANIKTYSLNLSNTPTWVASSNTDYPYRAELRYLFSSGEPSPAKDIMQLQQTTALGGVFASGTLSPFVRYGDYYDDTTQTGGYQVTIYSKDNTVSIGSPKLKVLK